MYSTHIWQHCGINTRFWVCPLALAQSPPAMRLPFWSMHSYGLCVFHVWFTTVSIASIVYVEAGKNKNLLFFCRQIYVRRKQILVLKITQSDTGKHFAWEIFIEKSYSICLQKLIISPHHSFSHLWYRHSSPLCPQAVFDADGDNVLSIILNLG